MLIIINIYIKNVIIVWLEIKFTVPWQILYIYFQIWNILKNAFNIHFGIIFSLFSFSWFCFFNICKHDLGMCTFTGCNTRVTGRETIKYNLSSGCFFISHLQFTPEWHYRSLTPWSISNFNWNSREALHCWRITLQFIDILL